LETGRSAILLFACANFLDGQNRGHEGLGIAARAWGRGRGSGLLRYPCVAGRTATPRRPQLV